MKRKFGFFARKKASSGEDKPEPTETKSEESAAPAPQEEVLFSQTGVEPSEQVKPSEQVETSEGEGSEPSGQSETPERAEIAQAIIGSEPEPAKKPLKERAIAFLKGMPKRYFITAFSGMAIGLFCTLIAGTIVEQIGKIFAEGSGIRTFIVNLAAFAKVLMGAGIGLGIAHSFKAPKMVLASCAVAGFLGANAVSFLNAGANITFGIGDPISSYLCSVVACELGLLVSGKTKVDILVVPLVVIFSASLVALALGRPVKALMDLIGAGINAATQSQPFFMGIIVSAVMGLLLTLPTSSAAIGVGIHLSGLAAGAAVAGCCAHMVGFAVASFRENRWGGLVAQGLGTSMLQIPNLGKNGRILIPAVVASIVTGPFASCVFGLQATAAGSGMGTAGLVGVIDSIGASLGTMPVWQLVLGVAVTYFILPAAIALGVSEFMRKKNWIRYGDMKIEL